MLMDFLSDAIWKAIWITEKTEACFYQMTDYEHDPAVVDHFKSHWFQGLNAVCVYIATVQINETYNC